MPLDINPATLALIVLQSVALVVWLVRANDNAIVARKRAEDAADDLDAYKRDNDERHRLTQASIALIREQFVRKEDLQHLEASIARQFDSLQKRLDTYFMNRTGE